MDSMLKKPKEKIVNFRVNEEEKNMLVNAAKLHKLPPSTFLRKIVFEYINNE